MGLTELGNALKKPYKCQVILRRERVGILETPLATECPHLRLLAYTMFASRFQACGFDTSVPLAVGRKGRSRSESRRVPSTLAHHLSRAELGHSLPLGGFDNQ